MGKLDGDIELPPDYYERLLGRFRDDPSLGLAGGVLVEPTGRGWQLRGTSDLQHVRGALKLYTRDCFETIGGVREMLGWDGVDEVLARMHGYRTRSFPDAIARHHRPVGTAQGRLRGSYRLGRSMFIEGYPFLWIAARSLMVGKSRPVAVTGRRLSRRLCGRRGHGVSRFESQRLPPAPPSGVAWPRHAEAEVRPGLAAAGGPPTGRAVIGRWIDGDVRACRRSVCVGAGGPVTGPDESARVACGRA